MPGKLWPRHSPRGHLHDPGGDPALASPETERKQQGNE